MSPPGILRVARAFFLLGLQDALSYRVAFALRLVAVALSLTSFYYMARFIDMGRAPLLSPYGGDYLGFLLVGMVVINLQHSTISAYPVGIRQAQLSGTLEAMLATPTPGWQILLCSPAYSFVTSFLWAGCYLAAGIGIFGVRFGPVGWPALGLTLPLCILAFASLGLLGGALTMLLRRGDPISLFIGGVSALLGGVMYPLGVLPPWMRALGRLLPITHTLEMTRRAVFAGATLAELAGPLADLSIFCLLALPAGALAFSFTLRRARRDGSLTHY